MEEARAEMVPASAVVNLNLLNFRKGDIENMSFLVEKLEQMVRRHGARTGRLALTDGTKRASTKDMSLVDLERHLVLTSDR